ncbi:hypothetical protein B0H14DRAFT_236296 [Mycena olivaceomarginata]|nr:hypothetical protein B0H14DRAFT_236296 [Mycena olivaceomarginata]
MYLCVLSALNPHEAGPASFTYDDPEDITDLAQEMAQEVVAILGQDYAVASIQQTLEETLSEDSWHWLMEYTGRKRYDCMEDNFYYTGVIIGRASPEDKVEVTRVEGFSYDYERWDTVVVGGGDGKEERVKAVTRCSELKGGSFFCWERPYLYFRDWVRHSCPPTALWDDSVFAEQFFRVVDSDHGDCRHRGVNNSGLLPCISYGGIEKAHDGDWQANFRDARNGSKKTAAAIAAGGRGRHLWPSMALDFGAWMVTRPDLWPTPSSASDASRIQLEPGTPTVFNTLPPEVLLEILPLLFLPDLLSLQLLSRGVAALVSPLLDETLWHHVHSAEFRWILPVAAVAGEVQRANRAAMKWCSKSAGARARQARSAPARLACVLDSKDFPFSHFLRECLKSDSMRNRERLWKISQQYITLWETTLGFNV